MTTPIATTSFLFLAAMLLIPSAQAMSPPPLHAVGRRDNASPSELWRGDEVE